MTQMRKRENIVRCSRNCCFVQPFNGKGDYSVVTVELWNIMLLGWKRLLKLLALLCVVFICVTSLQYWILFQIRYARELNNVEVNSRPTTTPVTQIVHTTNKTTETKIISDCEIFLNIPIMKELKTKRPRFNFTLTPWNIHMDNIRSPELNSSKQVIEWSMIVVVKSAASNVLRRKVTRWTWASFEYIAGLRMEIVFIVGNAKTPEDELELLHEHKKYGDLLQIDSQDTYHKIGLKTLAGMQWASEHFPPNWLYSSADDDMLPDLYALRNVIAKISDRTKASSGNETSKSIIPETPLLLCGYGLLLHSKPFRNVRNKWFINETDYEVDKYPPYCSGGWYTMSNKLSSDLYTISRTLPFFWIDDIWITGLIRLLYSHNLWLRDHSQAVCTVTANLWTERLKDNLISKTGDGDYLMAHWRTLIPDIRDKNVYFVKVG